MKTILIIYLVGDLKEKFLFAMGSKDFSILSEMMDLSMELWFESFV